MSSKGAKKGAVKAPAPAAPAKALTKAPAKAAKAPAAAAPAEAAAPAKHVIPNKQQQREKEAAQAAKAAAAAAATAATAAPGKAAKKAKTQAAAAAPAPAAAITKGKRKRGEGSKSQKAEAMEVDDEDKDEPQSGSGSGQEPADRPQDSESGSSEDDRSMKPASKKRRLLDGVAELEHDNSNWTSQRYRNKQRTLVFATRGITSRPRHLLNDLRLLMPHSRKEVKMDRKDKLYIVNEICELKGSNNCVFFEVRKHEDVFMWVSRVPHGPSAKFHVLNIHTMDELKLTGNALRGSRPVLSFDGSFDAVPHLRLIKEMFTQVFGTPNRHRKSKPFIDHVLAFTYVDNKIWFRVYQMYDQQVDAARDELRMVEIGPRLVLNPIRIFDGSFCGATLYENPRYLSPNQVRLHAKRLAASDFRNRKAAEAKRSSKVAHSKPAVGELDDVFD